jgi:hypothetical protein
MMAFEKAWSRVGDRVAHKYNVRVFAAIPLCSAPQARRWWAPKVHYLLLGPDTPPT